MQSLYQILREMAPALAREDFTITSDDPDAFDDTGAANDPNNPIWTGAPAHRNELGTDPAMPDYNDLTQD